MPYFEMIYNIKKVNELSKEFKSFRALGFLQDSMGNWNVIFCWCDDKDYLILKERLK